MLRVLARAGTLARLHRGGGGAAAAAAATGDAALAAARATAGVVGADVLRPQQLQQQARQVMLMTAAQRGWQQASQAMQRQQLQGLHSYAVQGQAVLGEGEEGAEQRWRRIWPTMVMQQQRRAFSAGNGEEKEKVEAADETEDGAAAAVEGAGQEESSVDDSDEESFMRTAAHDQAEGTDSDDDADAAAGGAEDKKEDSVEEELSKLEEELKIMRDGMMRAYAEAENTRRIAKADVEKTKRYAVQGFAKALLDVADNLRRAVESVPQGENALEGEAGEAMDTLLQGLIMTEDQLAKVFQANGVVQYGKVGEKFDPNFHDAMFTYEDPEQEPGTLGQVLKTGYLLHDRVIRPAQVGCIKAPETPQAAAPEAEAETETEGEDAEASTDAEEEKK